MVSYGSTLPSIFIENIVNLSQSYIFSELDESGAQITTNEETKLIV
jgi:hypothetical protein